VNVEHALLVLPNVEGFLPLRALLLTSASANRLAPEGNGSHRTVGKHELSADEVRARMPVALDAITGHFAALSEAYVHALGCIERGTPAEAVDDLIRAGTTEEWGGRISEAREWFSVALWIAEGLRDRRPESAAMLALGRLSMRTGNIEEATRCYRRSLELSEADGDIAAEIAACEGLGDVEVLRGLRPEGASWYARALARAQTTNNESRVALLRLALGKLWCAAGNLDAATEEIRHARASFEDLEEIENLVRTLCVQAEVERDLDRPSDSEATYREALAWSYRASESCGIAIPVHIGIARLYLHTGRPLDAEAEIRRAEQLAGTGGRLGWLVQIYTFLGTLSGLREDPDGFVFFEQALGFSRTLRNSPVYEARICVEYAGYRYRMKEYAEARARLNRAHTFFTLVGAAGEASVVEARLRLMVGG
jgi:tetratricopeptide (TPR) repeat protein